jgi:hypothetical protein
VQHQRKSLTVSQRIEHHLECEAHRVGQQDLLLRVGSIFEADDWIWHVDADVLLATHVA